MKYLLLYTFSCIHVFGYAQGIQTVWSETATRSRQAPYLARIVKGQQDEMITISFRGNPFTYYKPITPVATRFDSNLNPVLEKGLFTTGENVHFHSAFNFRERIYLFTTWYNRRERQTILYSTEIDPLTLEVLGRKELNRFDAISRNRQLDIQIKASEDTGHILVFATAWYPEKEPEKMVVQVLDHTMNKDWGKVITLPYTGKFVQVKSVEISNSGEVYILYKHYKNSVLRERVRRQTVPAYTYKLLVYGRGDTKPREFIPSLQNKFIHDVALQSNAAGGLYLAGLYKDEYRGWVSGHFITELNAATLQAVSNKLEPFPVEGLLKQLETNRSGSVKAGRAGMSDHFRVMGTNIRMDGSVDILAEKNYSYEERDSNSNTDFYVADDIVVINNKTDGQVQYTRIPKSQTEREGYNYISFKWMKRGNDLLLFYNDHKENVSRDLSRRPYSMGDVRRAVLVMATVDSRGELTREAVYDNKELDMVTMIKESEVFNNEALILYAERNRVFSKQRIRFGRLTLPY